MRMKSVRKIFIFISILLQSDFLFSQVVGDYRSVGTNTWSTLAIWERYNGAWVAAVATPTSADGVITIQTGTTVTINIAGLNIDQVIVDGTLITGTTQALTIANGAGVDLTINGTFQDRLTSGTITWTGVWQFGITGTLLKTSASSSNNWQTSYNGGAATMPSTANWILRKVAAANPSISSIGAYYPNLTIENNVVGTWITPDPPSSFTGAGGFPTIKGNFDIGGAGTSTVDFLNANTNATPVTVQGNMIIRTGNFLRNNGTGFEVQGNLTVNGTINYDANDARLIRFGGGNAQSFSGTGTPNIYNMTMSKSTNSLTLNRAITIDNLLTMTTGIINSSLPTNFPIINTAGTVAGANNSSFVNGPVRYIGTAAFTFPVGKGSDYQALGYTLTAGGGGTFWTETFSNGCAGGCLATAYIGPNGAWTVTDGVNGATPNLWYVSCTEDGCNAAGCGVGCGGNGGCPANDPSLHLGAVGTSDCGCLVCPGGDCGAAYDACDGFTFCGGSPLTDKRAESPTINCTGQSTINLNFNYIENGQGALDDATVWYYDGAVWAQIDNPPKVALCGGQGTWTARSIALPASANNNANVKIGFRWVNNADGLGADPSFAVDDITLSTAGPVVDFTCEYFYADPTTTFNNVMGAGISQIENCEYWVLTRNAGTASKNITLTWDANSCMAAPATITDYRVARWDGAAWQSEGSTATSGAVPPAGGTITSASVSNFSPFTIGSTVTWALPVELLSFTAVYNGKNVDVKWTTASEKNNDYFTIERTADGKTFHEVARVKGAGNSSTVLHYSTKDNDPLEGTSYYRLKQTDFDGKYEYSNLAVVTIDKKNVLEIISMNEDENGLLNVLLNCLCKSQLSVEIIDVTGKTVFSAKESPSGNSHRITANVSPFSNGLYLLKVSDGENIEWKKFVL